MKKYEPKLKLNHNTYNYKITAFSNQVLQKVKNRRVYFNIVVGALNSSSGLDQLSRADSGRSSGSGTSLQSSGVGSMSEGMMGNLAEGHKRKIHQEPSLEEEDIDDIVKAFKKSGSVSSEKSEKSSESGESYMLMLTRKLLKFIYL